MLITDCKNPHNCIWLEISPISLSHTHLLFMSRVQRKAALWDAVQVLIWAAETLRHPGSRLSGERTPNQTRDTVEMGNAWHKPLQKSCCTFVHGWVQLSQTAPNLKGQTAREEHRVFVSEHKWQISGNWSLSSTLEARSINSGCIWAHVTFCTLVQEIILN